MIQEQSFQQLTAEHQKLLLVAEQALQQAYNPGSGFVVGAAVLATNGKMYRGANVKLSSTGLVACAELAAVVQAMTAGERAFTAIAVTARHGQQPVVEPNYPCGRCCQMIYELNVVGDTDLQMIYANTVKDRIAVGTIHDFFPYPFASGLIRHGRPNEATN